MYSCVHNNSSVFKTQILYNNVYFLTHKAFEYTVYSIPKSRHEEKSIRCVTDLQKVKTQHFKILLFCGSVN